MNVACEDDELTDAACLPLGPECVNQSNAMLYLDLALGPRNNVPPCWHGN